MTNIRHVLSQPHFQRLLLVLHLLYSYSHCRDWNLFPLQLHMTTPCFAMILHYIQPRTGLCHYLLKITIVPPAISNAPRHPQRNIVSKHVARSNPNPKQNKQPPAN
jgi:hypothetical protein